MDAGFYDEIYPPVPHYLATCEDNSIIGMESWQQWDVDSMFSLIPHNDSDSDSEYSNNLLSNKYWNQSIIKWKLLWVKTLVLFIK